MMLADPSGTMPVLQNGENYSIAQPACDPNQPGSPCYDSTNDEVTPVPFDQDPIAQAILFLGGPAASVGGHVLGDIAGSAAGDAAESEIVNVIGRLPDTESIWARKGIMCSTY